MGKKNNLFRQQQPVFVVSGFDAVEWLAEHGIGGLFVVHLFDLETNQIL